MPKRKPILRRRRKGRWIGRSENRSVTGHVIERLAAGVPSVPPDEPEIPGKEASLMRMGDPDVSALQNEYSGEESPGATTPTPDQNLIDETGRAYGVVESGALRTSSELLDARDSERPGLPKAKARRAV